MPSAVSVCSNALVMLGAKPINDLTQATDHARICNNVYDTVRDSVLRAHTWNCATKRVQLAPLVAAPDFDFDHQFQLPGDWLRTVQVGEKDCPIPFRTEGQRILADVTVLPLVYIWRNKDVPTWSANLIHVMELAIAAKIAYAVTSSATVRDSQRDEFMRELKVAKAIDGQDDPPEEFASGSLYESRF